MADKYQKVGPTVTVQRYKKVPKKTDWGMIFGLIFWGFVILGLIGAYVGDK